MQGEQSNANDEPPDSPEERQQLAKMLMRLFELWRLDQTTQLKLLGLAPEYQSSLPDFARGAVALPQGRDIHKRAAYLLAIHKALRLLYPENPGLRYDWVNRRNRVFSDRTPLDVMRHEGLPGIAQVARFLDDACR